MALWAGSAAMGLAFGLLAVGVFLTFHVLRFPDLTVDGSFPLGAAVAALLLTHAQNPWLALVAAGVAGAAAGSVTGLLATKARLNGLLASILVSIALYSVILRMMGNRPNIPLFDAPSVTQALSGVVSEPNLRAILVLTLIGLVTTLAVDRLLASDYGLGIRAAGSTPSLAESYGVNPDRVVLVTISLANGLAGASGALVAQYQSFADVNMGLGVILVGLASVIIGDTLFARRGYRGALWGVWVGAVVYRLAAGLAIHLGLGPGDMKLVTALIVLAALAAPAFRARLGRAAGG